MSKSLRETIEDRVRKENKKSDFVCLYKAYEVSKIDPNDELKLDLHSDLFALDEITAFEIIINENAEKDIFDENANGSLMEIISNYKLVLLKLNIGKHELLNQLDTAEIIQYPSERYAFKISLDNTKFDFDMKNIVGQEINCESDNDKRYLTIVEMNY